MSGNNVKANLSVPWVQRGLFYGLALLVGGIGGLFGWLTQEQADSLAEQLPTALGWFFGTASSVVALFNLHRGSDSRATDEDVAEARKAVDLSDGLQAREVLPLLQEIAEQVRPTDGGRHALPTAPAAVPVDEYPDHPEGTAGAYPGAL